MHTSQSAPRWLGLVLATLLLYVPVAACSGSSPSPSAEKTTTTRPARGLATQRSGKEVKISGPFFGFNGASIIRNVNIDLLMNPKLQRQLASFPARLIRVPTGTAAQWIDWHTGKFIDDPTSPFASIGPDRHPITMADWASFIATTKATPVWDLNVLTSTLADQVAMLHEAKRLGMPVDYIELGNELWDVRSIYPKVFPSGTAYAHAMNAWIPTLRKDFPDAQIAVSGADPSDTFFSSVFGKRYTSWNDEVLATVKGADAIAIHPYWTLPDRAAPGSDVPATLTAGLDAWNGFAAETLAKIPGSMSVWLTEWNQAAWGSKSGTQIWAQALSVVAVALHQLSDPQITMSLVHDIVDGVRNPQDVGISTTFPAFTDGANGSKPLERTALGHALPLLFGAVPPGSRVQTLHVPTARRTGTHSSVVAVAISGREPGAVFVNLAAKPVRIRLPRGMDGTWEATAVSAAPDSQPGWVAADKVTTGHRRVQGSVTLPASSVVRLARP